MLPGSPDRLIGIRQLDHNSFSADFLRGDGVSGQSDVLMQLAARIDAATFKQEYSHALEIARTRFAFAETHSAGDPRTTSMILYRHASATPGDVAAYGGYSLQQEIEIQTSKGTQDVLFWLIRALQDEYQDHGLGRFDMQQGFIRHEKAVALFHRLGSPVSPWSVIRSNVVREDLYYPWHSLYGRGDDSMSKLAQEIMFPAYFLYREAGIAKALLPPNDSTGVAIADWEPNVAYRPKPGHIPTAELYEYMQKTLKMGFRRGDRVYSVGFAEPQ